MAISNTQDEVVINIVVKSEEASKSLDNLSEKTKSLNTAVKALGFGALIKGAKETAKAMASDVNRMGDYIEQMNLFRAVMGDSASAAQTFIDKAERLLGLDPGKMMHSFAAFQSLTEGFGIASDRAFIMSQNLTQLAADLMSFHNISFDKAMQKVKSGIAGKIFCLAYKGLYAVIHLIAGNPKHVMV